VGSAVDGEADAERAVEERLLLALIADPDIVADGPFAIGVAEVGEGCGFGWVGEEGGEGAFAVVVVLAGEVDDGLAFHVGLACEDEDFKRFGFGAGDGDADRKKTGDKCGE
jgi:hypothetical protein